MGLSLVLKTSFIYDDENDPELDGADGGGSAIDTKFIPRICLQLCGALAVMCRCQNRDRPFPIRLCFSERRARGLWNSAAGKTCYPWGGSSLRLFCKWQRWWRSDSPVSMDGAGGELEHNFCPGL